MSNITICVYGAGSSNIDDIYIQETAKLGRELACRGHKMIFGGGSTGLMGACAGGALAEGGTVIGVVPEFMKEYQLLEEHCTEMVWTQTMSERKDIMESRSDAFIILPGGVGTLDEFFEILTLENLNRKSAPIILYNVSGFYNDLISFIDKCIQKGFIKSSARDLLRVSSDPAEVLDLIEYFA